MFFEAQFFSLKKIQLKQEISLLESWYAAVEKHLYKLVTFVIEKVPLSLQCLLFKDSMCVAFI